MTTTSSAGGGVWRSDERGANAALSGLRVVDFSQNAPGPFASMVLGDFGADVIQVAAPHAAVTGYLAPLVEDKLVAIRFSRNDSLMRNKRSVTLDLKSEAGRTAAQRLADQADVLIEEMRPGKMAKIGLGFDVLSARNPRLVYCSITGYGQTGVLAQEAGHDINYVARSGALDLIRDAQGVPCTPLNYLADYAGGGLMAVTAILIALQARERTGRGQHVDVAMTEGVKYLSTDLFATWVSGRHHPACWRGTLGGDAPFYRIYGCREGGFLAVGALERRFADNLCQALGRPDLLAAFEDRSRWPEAAAALSALFASRERDDWIEALDGVDCCVSPVLGVEELDCDAQRREDNVVSDAGGVIHVGVGPKLSETPGRVHRSPVLPGADTQSILASLG